MQEGLKELEIYDVVKSNAEIFQSVKFSNEQLISLVEIEEAKGKGHNDILTWLEQFISESSDKFA